MTKGVRVQASVAERGIAAELNVPAGRITALVGPNGAGKSTVLGLISGLLPPTTGAVEIDGQPTTGVPAHRRPVAVLEQRPLLFPHLNVLDNVAFGVRARGASRPAARARAREELNAVGASDFAERRPSALSGGEAQRVALARALATDPAVLLLDEPFGALDVPTAVAMRHLLAARLRGPGQQDRTVLLVTHDPLDLWALADRVVALEGGRVRAQGEVAALLGRPPTRFLAELSGTNLLRGVTVAGPDQLAVAVGDAVIVGMWDELDAPGADQPALATFPPAAVALFTDSPHGSPRNTWAVHVTALEPRGATVRVRLELMDGQPLAADLTAQGVAALALRPGDHLLAQVKATQVALYPRTA